MSSSFRLGITADVARFVDDLESQVDLFAPIRTLNVSWEFIREYEPIPPSCSSEFDALLVLGGRIDRASLSGERLSLVARLGVGTDKVDLDACADAGVVVTVTREAVRRPMASAMLTLILALSHRLVQRDRLARSGRWGERGRQLGTGLHGQTLGLIGLGGISREFLTIAKPLGLRYLAFDPYLATVPDGISLTTLDRLVRESDIVAVACALTRETFHLLGERELSLMKSSAYLVNVARGAIIDETALTRVLARGAIAGAGLDVLEHEPPASDHPLFGHPNVIVTPHCLGWTDQLFADMIEEAIGSVRSLLTGAVPPGVANPRAVDSPRFLSRLRG